MTDKQIIIDGVDVSGCPHYILKDGSCSSQDCECVKCVHNVCFYKSYKTKEQECEAYKMEADEGKEINAELKAENEKMSKGYSKLTEIVSPYMDDFTGYNEELGGFDLILCVKELLEQLDQLKRQHEADKGLITSTGKMNYQLIQEYDKLKTALTEIKEIAETAAKCMYATYSDDYTEGYRWLGSIILQKISECEGNDEQL